MITMIAHMRVAPVHAAEYENILAYVTEMTLQHEPGVPYYAWSKSVDDPGTYMVVEVYRDEQAHAAHMASAWVRDSLPRVAGLIEGKLDIRQYVSPGQAPVELKHG